MRPFSHSSISLYLQCPLKYKLHYIDGLKEKPKSYLSFGKSVHEALEFIFGSKMPTPPSLESVLDTYKVKWINEGYKDTKEENEYFDYGKRIIQEFYKKHTHPYKIPLAVEHQLYFEVNGIKVTAIMDRIDKLDDGTVEIIDYKTSKNPFNLSDLADEPQLSMYQLAVEKEMGLRVEKLTYYHLRSQTPFTIPKHSDENIEKQKEKIIDVASRIQNEEFPHKENSYCPCDFAQYCPLHIHEFKKDIEKEEKAIDIVKAADEYGTLKDQEKELSAKINAVQEEIKEYMQKENLNRVFGDTYEVTKTKSSRETFDQKKAKEILEAENRLNGLISFKESETIRYKEKKADEEGTDFA